jgi:hypothetical protein
MSSFLLFVFFLSITSITCSLVFLFFFFFFFFFFFVICFFLKKSRGKYLSFIDGGKWGCPLKTVICYIEVPFKTGLIVYINMLMVVMVFNATFNNISVIWWWSALLVEETGVPAENHQSVTSHWQTSSHNVVLSTPHLSGIRTHNVSGDTHWLHR